MPNKLEFDKVFSARAVILSVLSLVFFYPIYPTLYQRFSSRDSYYSHGFIVPFIVLFLVWRNREALRAIKPEPALIGLFVFVFGVLIHLASLFLKINFTSYAAVLFVISGLALYLGGKQLFRELLFPIAFIAFMLPLPDALIVTAAFKLKMIAAGAAAAVGEHMGVRSWVSGSIIYYPGGHLLVGDPCSGIRSLISFLALGALVTQFTDACLWRKTTLFLLTIPIAIFSNIARLTFLLLFSYVYGEKAAMGFVHDLSGFAVFVVGFFCFMAVGRVLKCQFQTKTI
jgi:exosortase